MVTLTQPGLGFSGIVTAPMNSGANGSASTQLDYGIMVWDPAMGYDGAQANFEFQYNPSSIEASYQIQSSTANAGSMYPITTTTAINLLDVPARRSRDRC